MILNGKRRIRIPILSWTVLAAISCATASAGCVPLGWLGPNLTLSFNIPLGLNGNPGFYNPFGIVQAVVNQVLGINGAGSGNGDAGLPGEDDNNGVGGIL